MSYNTLKALNQTINDLDRSLTAKEIDFHNAMQRGDNLIITSLDIEIKEIKVALKQEVELLRSLEG